MGGHGKRRRRLGAVARWTLAILALLMPWACAFTLRWVLCIAIPAPSAYFAFMLVDGEALADEIPDARLLRLEGAGHGVYRAEMEAIVAAIL